MAVSDREQLEKAEILLQEIKLNSNGNNAGSDWDSLNRIYFLVKRYQEEKIQGAKSANDKSGQ